MKKLLPLVLFLLAPSSPALAYRSPTVAPKLALYDVKPAETIAVDGNFSAAEQKIVAKYDLVASSCDPLEASVCKANNPDAIMIATTSFGSVFPIEPPLPFWTLRDTTNNVMYRLLYYTKMNWERGVDWRYKKADQTLLPPVWGKQELNWTRSCPRGVFGLSAGKTVAEFVQDVVWPDMMQDETFRSNWDGYLFDTFPTADCWNSAYVGVDYNYDGTADDCYNRMNAEQAIAFGHPWTMEKVDATEKFFRYVIKNAPPRFPVLYGQDVLYSPVASIFSGWKIEGWMTQPGAAQVGSKWLRFWDGQSNTTGYHEAELKFARFGHPEDAQYDSLQGWDMSVLQMRLNGSWSASKKRQMARFGLGTTLLGDGYFAVSVEGNASVHASYYEIPEMWSWQFRLPALTEVFLVPDAQVPTATLFCRRYIDARTGTTRTVVVDTLRQNAYLALQAVPTDGESDRSADAPVTEAMLSAASDLSVSPNPSGAETGVRLSLGAAYSATRVEVFDVAGRLVQSLYSGPLAVGVHRFGWNGLDDQGRRSAAGIYFVRAQANGLSLGSRVVRLQ